MKKLLCLLPFLYICLSGSYAQALRGTTGLLHMPTAEMQQDKTFMFGGNYLNTYSLSKHFDSAEVNYTYNYYLNITIFPWLEVGYTCTLVHADHGSNYFPPQSWGKFANQDRAFNFRIRLWKEGWWKSWTPQIVLGLDDPATHSDHGGGGIDSGGDSGNNNYLTRYYLAATKYFDIRCVGEVGVHAAYIIGNAMTDIHYKRPSLGVNLRLKLPESSFVNSVLNGFNIMLEYDARTINVGGVYSIWKDRINIVSEFNGCRHFSGGVNFRIHLK